MANSYSKLAQLDDESETPGSGYQRLLALDEKLPAKTVEAPQEGWWKRTGKELTDPQAWKHGLGIIARGAIEGIQSPITIPADFGVAVRNKIAGSNYKSLSQMRDEELDTWGLPRPKSGIEKVNSFVAGALAGSLIPSPSAKVQAPENFVKPAASPIQDILQKGRDEGYVVPPSTAKPSFINQTVEGIAGKASVAQQASIRNQEVTNELARRALSLKPGEPITPAALHGIREAAGEVYAQIGNAGKIVADDQYVRDLVSIGKGVEEVSKAFPGANVGASKQIDEMVDSLLQNSFDSKAALQYLRELRKMSSANLSGINAADPAKTALGMAQKEGAATLEDLIGRHLTANGMEDVAQSFSGARKIIAMTHSVEDALNESTGNVIASNLGKQLGRGKPLSGDLETIARFSRAFPKASKEVAESMPGISPLDWYAAAFGHIATLGARLGMRKLALSPLMQGTASMPAAPVLSPLISPTGMMGGAATLQGNQNATE